MIINFAAKEKLEIVKERGEPPCGRAANHGGLLSPPAAAKNVRANLRIVHKYFVSRFVSDNVSHFVSRNVSRETF